MKILTSFRATTRNPAIIFSRLIAVFGVVMMFAAAGWSTNTYYKVERPFTTNHVAQKLASFNITGDFNVTGASVQCAVNSSNQCITTPTSTFTVKTKHLQTLPASFSNLNSESATLQIPTGATIKWAGLLWQGHIHGLKSDIGSPADASAIGNAVKNDGIDYDIVKFRTPDGTDHIIDVNHTDSNEMNSFSLEDNDEYRFFYQGFKDVTDIVKNSYSLTTKTFTVGDIQSTAGDVRVMKDPIDNWANESWSIGNHANWSLVVVFEEPSYDFQNVSVYDGFKIMKVITSGDFTTPMNIPIHIDGFFTPTSGTVNSKLMFYAGGGNKSANRDSFEILNANTGLMDKLTNAVNPSDNVFNDTFSYFGTNVNSTYHHLMDIDTFDISSKMKNNQNETDINLYVQYNNGADIAFVGLVAFSTKIYMPSLCYLENIFKGTTNISGIGAQVDEGDDLTVRVYLKNTGNENAYGVQLQHQFDGNFSYVSNSANYNNSNPPYETLMPPSYTRTAASDSSGDDLYEYDTTTLISKINLGASATSGSGGLLYPISSAIPTYAVYEYNATVNVLDSNYSNVYKVAYVNSALGIDYSNNPVTMQSCDGSKNSFYAIGSVVIPASGFDARNSTLNDTSDNNRSITTKIVEGPFQLNVLSLNESGNIASYPHGTTSQVYLLPVEAEVCTQTNINPTTLDFANSSVAVTFAQGDTIKLSPSMTIDRASREKQIAMNYIDWNEKESLMSDISCSVSSLGGSTLQGVPQCLQAEGGQMHMPNIQYVFGLDTYNACVVDPLKPPCKSQSYAGDLNSRACQENPSSCYPTPPYDNEYGCYQCLANLAGKVSCSTDNFAIRPNEFNTTMTLNQQIIAGQATSVTFRANQFGGIGTVDYNESEHTSFVVDLNISDTTKVCQDMNISFSPDINFTNGTVTGNYTLNNVGDFNVTIHEIVGSEYALVDADSGDTAEIDRLITPYQQQIKVIPDHFSIDGNVTNGSNGFTYFSNFEAYPTVDSRNLSVSLDLNITAKGAGDQNLSNYTELCYAKDGNITMSLNTALNVSPAGSVTKMLWYDGNHDENGSVALGGTSYIFSTLASQFDSADNNGTAEVNYLINFDRNETKVVDPFILNVNTINYQDSDSATANPVLNLDQNVTFVYGRLIPRDVRVFGNVGFTANAWYEVFNTPTLAGTGLAPSRNSPQWFINALHNDNNDGDGNITRIQNNSNATVTTVNIGSAEVNGMETYTFDGIVPTYSGKAHINTDPWLWFGTNALNYGDPSNANLDCRTHPCFNINVVPAIGATGSAKTADESTKSNKSSSGGGTWKSTSDYAPAIR